MGNKVSLVVVIFCALVLGAVLAAMFGAPGGIAAAIVSGLVFGGHLVSLDGDSPGGWSNPDGRREIWSGSLKELLAKFAVFAVVAAATAWYWAAAVN